MNPTREHGENRVYGFGRNAACRKSASRFRAAALRRSDRSAAGTAHPPRFHHLYRRTARSTTSLERFRERTACGLRRRARTASLSSIPSQAARSRGFVRRRPTCTTNRTPGTCRHSHSTAAPWIGSCRCKRARCSNPKSAPLPRSALRSGSKRCTIWTAPPFRSCGHTPSASPSLITSLRRCAARRRRATSRSSQRKTD